MYQLLAGRSPGWWGRAEPGRWLKRRWASSSRPLPSYRYQKYIHTQSIVQKVRVAAKLASSLPLHCVRNTYFPVI
jgi:hypothetical protein